MIQSLSRLAIFKVCLLGMLFATSIRLPAQVGGMNAFGFLNLPITSRQVGLGGYNVSSTGQDVAMIAANPALLTDSVADRISLSYYGYYAGISHNQFSYARRLGQAGLWGLTAQQVNYGTFDSYDPTGVYLGTFKGRDVAFALTHARQIRYFSLGLTAKFAQQVLDVYQASGLFFDLGGAFIHPQKDLTVGLAIQNIGFALSNFSSAEPFEMPLNVLLGATYRPEGMPFRMSVTLHHLQRFLDVAFEDPALRGRTDAFGQPLEQNISLADKLSRHVTLGSEIVLGKKLNLRLGYGFMTRREMLYEPRRGLTGFSMGVMMRIKRIEVAYSAARRHIAGSSHHLSIALSPQQLFFKKKVVD